MKPLTQAVPTAISAAKSGSPILAAPEGAEALLQDGLTSVKEAMAFLCISRSTLYQLMDKGELCYVKLRGSRRIPRRALTQLAATHLKGGWATEG